MTDSTESEERDSGDSEAEWSLDDGGPLLEYDHSAVTSDALDSAASAIDEVFSNDSDDWDFAYLIEDGDLIERHGLTRRSPLVQELRHITGYRLKIHGNRGPGAELTCATVDDTSNHAWPPPISRKSIQAQSLWADLASRVKEPRSICRLEDLLFRSRHGKVRLHAERAINTYKEVFDRSAGTAEYGAYLLRGWELSRLVKDSSSESDFRSRLLACAKTEISGENRPGLPISLVAAAAAWPRGTGPDQAREANAETEDEVDRTIDAAIDGIGIGRFATQLVEIKKPRLRPTETLEEWRKLEVDTYANEARTKSGFVKQSKLEDAIRQAKRYGLTELARELTAEMQRIPAGELRLASFQESVEIPIDLAERLLNRYTNTTDWRDGLRAFLFSDVPTGDIDWLRESGQETLRTSMLAALFRTRMINHERLPTWTSKGPEDDLLHAMSMPAGIQARFNGSILAEGLARMRETYGIPTHAELVDYLSVSGTANVEINAIVAKAFLLFWQEEFDASAHLAVPQVEAAARLLLIELDRGVYNIHLGESPSGYPYLSSLLDELESLALDPSWAYFIRWLLISPVGMNLRNDISHGLSRPISSVYAALILRAVALLASLTTPKEALDEEIQEDASVRQQPRTKGDLLQRLAHPVPDPVPFPIRKPTRGAKMRGLARIARTTGRIMILWARRLDGSNSDV